MNEAPPLFNDIFKECVSEAEHDQQIEKLEQYIASQRNVLSQIKTREQETMTWNESDVEITTRNLFKFVLNEYALVSKKFNEFQIKSFTNLLKEAEEIRDYMKSHLVSIDFNKFNLVIREKYNRNKEYIKLRVLKKRLASRCSRIANNCLNPDYMKILKIELVTAASMYDSNFNYSPPSPLDKILAEYIYNSHLAKMVEPTSAIIAEGTPEAAISTIGEFNLALLKNLNVTSGPPPSVIYISLIRLLFGISYTMGRELAKYTDEDKQFLFYCEQFARQSVRDLKLSDFIMKKFTAGLPIQSIFRMKQVEMLMPMEFMTNPIDLMYHVNKILNALATFFASNEGFLSFDDTLTLLIALMSISPPSNAISISKFVNRWEIVQISSVVSIAKNYFIAAIEEIQNFGKRLSS